MVHVLVEKGKDLKTPENSTVDPIIEIECLGQRCHSTAKSGIYSIGEVVWNEHLFLEPHNVEQKEAEDGKIRIKVMDKGFFKNSLIG